MRRTIAGLTALLLVCAVFQIEKTEAGRHSRACCTTCCTPQPTTCNALACTADGGLRGAPAQICLQSQMFNFGDGATCMYNAYCYPTMSCNDPMNPPSPCMWDGDCGLAAETCGHCSSKSMRVCVSSCRLHKHVVSNSTGLKKKIDLMGKNEHDVRSDEDSRLFDRPHMKILRHYNVKFTTNKPDNTTDDTVLARLLVIEWSKPTPPYDDGDPLIFAIGYEITDFPAGTTKVFNVTADPTDTTNVADGYRMVHLDLDYAVRIFPQK